MKATVKDVMSAEVVAVRRGASFKEMAASLRQYRVSAFPVIDDDGKVIGVVSEPTCWPRRHWPTARPGSPARSPACCTTSSVRRPMPSPRVT